MTDFSECLRAAIHATPERPVMEFKGRVFTAGELATYGDALIAMIEAAGVPEDAAIGIILRNRPIHAAVVQGLVAMRRPITTIYSMQSAQAIAADLDASRFAVVVADQEDWSEPVAAAARRNNTVAIALDLGAESAVELVGEPVGTISADYRRIVPEPGIEILSSGTTGTPKRILFPYRMLIRAVESITYGRGSETLSADIVTLPFTGIGGMCGVVAQPLVARYSALLEKFNVPEFVDAARRLRPTLLSGPPTIPRMLMDANVAPEDLSSVRYWYGGGSPFPPELQDEFEERYGIRTIWAYGATEFCGTVISWTIDLDREYRQAKRGAVGKALPGVELRVVDVQTHTVLTPGKAGYLEALIPAIRPDWIRTTDIVEIDVDGFVWHHGRGDGAILRGGFKILPEKVAEALLVHPAVLDACVVGLADRRLGEVPAAAVMLRDNALSVTEPMLIEHVRTLLPANHVPARICILPELPRTTSLKIDLSAVRYRIELEMGAENDAPAVNSA
ncbi:class I adenylate-forming enzyme family protein [Sphingobium baderi]|uniref:AMP-dependent synthetase n=1 Tax=Sphingobium baderi LL03 TaxID=1114964 RepID=T0HE28_9SPHN|nr:class I adenylate-forming enzyme family protein [Sphingobium baderi]EQA97659.1 hypothetical protein L485_20595 [Sphingobium baderi LL03]KMS63649.1 AMP-dependent synthetase [Sphingobium baderi LL03]WRD77543.1 class I adenylate-forming enzyme family protein [Sphingobium baderi]